MTALSRCDKLATLYADLLGDLPPLDRRNQFRIVCEGDAFARPSDPSLAAFYQSFDRIRAIMSKRTCGPEFQSWLEAYLKHCVELDDAESQGAAENPTSHFTAEWLERWESLEPWMRADVQERLAVLVPPLDAGRAIVLLDRSCPCEYYKKSWGKHFHMVLVHELSDGEAADYRAKLAAIPTRHDPLGHFIWTLDWRGRTPDMTRDWLKAFGIEVPWRGMFEVSTAPMVKGAPVFAPAECRCASAAAAAAADRHPAAAKA
jgi:hypothetical protein